MKFEEEKIQKVSVMLFKYKYPNLKSFLIHIPNGGNKQVRFNKSGKAWCPQGKRNKELGVREGASDLLLCIPCKGYHGYWLECKTQKGRQDVEQKQFEKDMISKGYKYDIFRSSLEFEQLIEKYLN